MREFKYLNESGTQKGTWFMNRLDYFEFESFSGMFWLNLKCVILNLVTLYIIREGYVSGVMIMLFYYWIFYVTLLTMFLSLKKRCRYQGYFLYPSRIIKKFKAYKKPINLLDFDSLATMQNSGVDREMVTKTRSFHLRD